MNYVCGKAASDKEKILNVFNKQSKTTDKMCCSVKRFTADCKCVNHYSKTDGQHKIKRLKSRKERSQMRGGGTEASKSKSHHRRCCRQVGKDMAHFHNCCHSSCLCPSRRDAPFPNVVPAAQEPSIITDSRLIGHQGLFNHEVKSIDIERLLSEQAKLEKSGQQVREKCNAASHPSSTSPVPFPVSTNDLSGADNNEVMPFEKKAPDDCQDKEEKISHESDLTPGQRPQQRLDLSSGSFKSISSSKHSSLDVMIIESCKTNPVKSEKGREAQLTPTFDRENVKTLNKNIKRDMVFTLEHTPKNQESPVHQTQACGLSPSPIQLSSSHTADGFDIECRKQDPESIFKSVSAVAAGLCDGLRFPLMRRRSLVAESREVLLKALREKHGPQLQENLLEVQRRLRFDTDPTKEVQDQGPAMVDEDELLPTDAFPMAFQANTSNQPHFLNQKTTSIIVSRSKHFNWKSSPQLHCNLKPTAEQLISPEETSLRPLDDILRPTCSPQFCMDFEPSGVTGIDHLFTPSPTSCWSERASASQHCEDAFNRPRSKEAVMFGSFENSFMNHTRAVTEKRSASQHSDGNIQCFFPHQAQLPHSQSAEPMHFAQKRNPFEIDRSSVAPSFSAQIHYPDQRHHFQPLSPPFRSHHTDTMHYTPFHMLERDPPLPLSSLTSPEHWSFPPMRLY